MNINKLGAAFSAAVVMILTACTDSPVPATPITVPTASASSQPSIAIQSPAGYDEWELSAIDETIPEMEAMAEQFGVDKIVSPNSARFNKGFVGYSQLENYCVVGFMTTGANPDAETLSVTVMSRYNQTLTTVSPDVAVSDIRALLDELRPICRGEAPIPTTTTQVSA